MIKTLSYFTLSLCTDWKKNAPWVEVCLRGRGRTVRVLNLCKILRVAPDLIRFIRAMFTCANAVLHVCLFAVVKCLRVCQVKVRNSEGEKVVKTDLRYWWIHRRRIWLFLSFCVGDVFCFCLQNWEKKRYWLLLYLHMSNWIVYFSQTILKKLNLQKGSAQPLKSLKMSRAASGPGWSELLAMTVLNIYLLI